MKTCNKCGAPMAGNNPNMGYCTECGAWSKFEHEPVAKPEPPMNIVGPIEVALDEKACERFMREAKDPDSPMRKAIAQADSEDEVRKAITNAITRMNTATTVTTEEKNIKMATAELTGIKKGKEEVARKTTFAISHGVNRSTQKSSFTKVVKVTPDHNKNCHEARENFINLGYQVILSLRAGDTLYINTAGKVSPN